MKLLIDIEEKEYQRIMETPKDAPCSDLTQLLYRAVRKGLPLSDLVDTDKLTRLYKRAETEYEKKHEEYRRWMKSYVKNHMDELGLCDGVDAMD